MKLSIARKAILSRFIFNTISRWAAVFGVVNASALLLSLGYVFFILPKRASNEAQILLRQETTNQTAALRTTIDQLNQLVGQVRERAESSVTAADRLVQANANAEEQLKNIQRKIATLDAQFKDAESSNAGAVSQMIAEYIKHPDIAGILPRVAVIERTLEAQSQEAMLRNRTEIGYIKPLEGFPALRTGSEVRIAKGIERFKTPYKDPPMLMLVPIYLDIVNGTRYELRTVVLKDGTGFAWTLRVWGDTQIFQCELQWFSLGR